jgi:hypothetical protein
LVAAGGNRATQQLTEADADRIADEIKAIGGPINKSRFIPPSKP